MSRDPIAESGGLNLYGYVDANPVRNVDPDGLVSIAACANPANAVACAEAGIIAFPPVSEMVAPGRVVDTQIESDYNIEASKQRQCGKEPPDRCKWLKENKWRYSEKQVKATEKAWGCRGSRLF